MEIVRMSSALLNDTLRMRIHHLRDSRIEKANEAVAMKLSENHRSDESIQRQMEAEFKSAENRIDRFVNPRSRHDVAPDMSDHVPFDDAEFSERDQSLKNSNGRFIREEPW
jgi:hypothetical protein